MMFYLHVLRGDEGRDKRVFRDLRDAIRAACACIDEEGTHPEEILAGDGRVVMTHDQIGLEWARRTVSPAARRQGRAQG
jgi:hypothetical protein